MIKQCPKDYKFKYPKDGAICLEPHWDLSVLAFELAWNEAIKKADKLVFPMHLICNYICSNVCELFNRMLKGDILIANTNDRDEWWLTFVDVDGNDVDVVFYSTGV